jgi:hypothetical protein
MDHERLTVDTDAVAPGQGRPLAAFSVLLEVDDLVEDLFDASFVRGAKVVATVRL